MEAFRADKIDYFDKIDNNNSTYPFIDFLSISDTIYYFLSPVIDDLFYQLNTLDIFEGVLKFCEWTEDCFFFFAYVFYSLPFSFTSPLLFFVFSRGQKSQKTALMTLTILLNVGATPVMKALIAFLTGFFPKVVAIYMDGSREKIIKL